MTIEIILRHLENSGFRVLGSDGAFIWLEDPTCFVRQMSDFVDVAWVFITFFAGVLLFGWGVSLIRSAKGNSVNNIRNLFLMFGTLAAARPIANTIWGGDLFGLGCKTIQVPVAEVNKIIDSANLKLKTREENELFESIEIYDSASGSRMPNVMGDINTAIPSEPIKGAGIISTGAAPGAQGNVQVSNVNGLRVSFIGSDGRRHTKVGGTLAWMNNNPGNIVCSAGLIFGAVGCNGRFLVFPSESVGMRAIVLNLKSSYYQRLTLGGAIATWAPPNENNTAGYQQKMEQRTGISLNTPMSTLTDAQLEHIAGVIRQIEGWVPGQEIIE